MWAKARIVFGLLLAAVSFFSVYNSSQNFETHRTVHKHGTLLTHKTVQIYRSQAVLLELIMIANLHASARSRLNKVELDNTLNGVDSSKYFKGGTPKNNRHVGTLASAVCYTRAGGMAIL